MMAHAIVINLGNHLLSHCGVPRLRARATAELVADAGVGWAAADLVAGARGDEPGGVHRHG
jgi:hypothetical protein